MGKMIERQCPICDKMYYADTMRLKHGRQTTCSRKCSYKLRAQKLSKSIELTCPVCGETFERTPAQIERAKYTNVCSRNCLYKARSLGIIKREVTEPYEYTPESKQALIEAARRPKGKRVHHWLTCANCGKRFDDPNWGRERKNGLAFCSPDCCNEYRTGKNNPAWRGGHDSYYGPNWHKQRRKARKRDNYTCQECNITEDVFGQELDVHHIVRFGAFENHKQANKLSNLVSLCHSCHMAREWEDNQ